jgi:hypothetical protein
MITPTSTLMERLGFAFGLGLLFLLAFTTAAPYVFSIKSPELIRQIDQTQNTIQNLCLILASFLYGTSVGKRIAENTIDTLAKTAQAAGAALSSPADSISLAPGASATVAATDSGTEIKPEP